MYGIKVCEKGAKVTVGMWGEFDVSSLPKLREGLDYALALGRPTVVDLSGITFLDLQSTRELVVRSLFQAHQIAFERPSPGVVASFKAIGMEDGTRIQRDPGREGPQVFTGA